MCVLCLCLAGCTMAVKKDPLKTYRKRRDFTESPEPRGKKQVTSPAHPELVEGGKRIFVIQKHAASHLHYDFRIEVEGVLKSWAVPKGPSLNPKIKRLAIPTDDHPIEYATFEGTIPEGHYGAGTVMVWDTGTYRNIKKKKDRLVSMKKCVKDGQIEVWLEGKKLQGGYALIKTIPSIHRAKRGTQDERDRWLLIKMRDEHASAKRNPVNTQNKSVQTGRTMAQIRKDTK